MNMFCYQCQETVKNQGCEIKGACGKTAETANLQDLLTWLLKGISYYAVSARPAGLKDPGTDRFVVESLFSTVTNVNFDPARFLEWITEALEKRDALRSRLDGMGALPQEPAPEAALWHPETGDLAEMEAKGLAVGVMADPDLDPDVRALRELLIYGLKGIAAYTDHARVLGYEDDSIAAFIQDALVATTQDLPVSELVDWVVRCGKTGAQAMALLDKANTETYGNPEPTRAELGVRPGPGILVSGHDLRDLAELLEQTRETGINIYTHGEMLPALAYPAFKKYAHLAGNYGGSWWEQAQEFESFNGPILMTTNCLVKPRDSYRDRLFTTSLVGWPGLKHIPDREDERPKDFSEIIRMAGECPQPEELESGTIPIGFAHATVLGKTEEIVQAIESGAIRRFVVMGGCDGRHNSREYFTQVAESLPKDTIILTAGCAKYRYNKLDLGEIAGIPRILDAGQCNDSYSLVVIAQKLAERFGVKDVNDLPISYDIAWYEQKAVIVLLALLALGVKKIRLGPTLPAFLSPGVTKVLVENFDLKPVGEVEEDVEAMLAGR